MKRQKTIRKTLMATCLVVSLVSCEQELKVYNETTDRLNFYYSGVDNTSGLEASMIRTDYSFIYAGEQKERDTVWLELETMGYVYDRARTVTLKQIPDTSTGFTDAEEGVHFVSLDEPSLQQKYKVPGGMTRARVPVVVLRDASLKAANVVLRLRIEPNEDFANGYEAFQERVIVISDQLTQPASWYATYCYYNFGDYGPVKHQFLIEQTGERWDEDYISTLMSGDEAYVTYLAQKLRNRLAEVNAERVSEGLGVLCEADGTEVVIEYVN